MDKIVRLFANSHGLTARETEILGLLCKRITSLKDIASALGLSPNTVNNHFKSIFSKTETNSRSELLVNLMTYAFRNLSECKYLHKQPHVLVVDDEAEICDLLSRELKARGFRVSPYTSAAAAVEALRNLHFDAVVSDIRMPTMDGIEFIQEIRKQHRYCPAVFFITGFAGQAEYDLLHLGAAAILEKPINFERLYFLIMEQFIENREERNRILKMSERVSVKIESVLRFRAQNLGYGGVFLPLEAFAGEHNLATLSPGSVISFRFQLEGDEHTFPVTGEIAWKRSQAEAGLEPGVGVKFLDLEDTDRTALREHVLLKKQVSFIPSRSAATAR